MAYGVQRRDRKTKLDGGYLSILTAVTLKMATKPSRTVILFNNVGYKRHITTDITLHKMNWNHLKTQISLEIDNYLKISTMNLTLEVPRRSI